MGLLKAEHDIPQVEMNSAAGEAERKAAQSGAPQHVRGRLLAVRLGVAAGIVGLAGLSAVTIAAAAPDVSVAPVGDMVASDAIVNGTVRKTGSDLMLFSGTRLESLTQMATVYLSRGGELGICPHSQVQVLTSKSDPAMMIAFQSGGAREPFTIRPADVVMTPDWRVELNPWGAEAAPAQPGQPAAESKVQVVMSGHGDEMCLVARAAEGQSFRVTSLMRNMNYVVPGNGTAFFAQGAMQSGGNSCGCAATTAKEAAEAALAELPAMQHATQPVSQPASMPEAARSIAPAPATAMPDQRLTPPEPVVTAKAEAPANPADATLGPSAAAAPAQIATAKSSKSNGRQHPQDLVGAIRSFLHFLFGR